MSLHDGIDDEGCSAGRPLATSLADELGRAIARLVEDAVEHAPVGGQIAVRVTRWRSDLEIAIEERGRRATCRVRVPEPALSRQSVSSSPPADAGPPTSIPASGDIVSHERPTSPRNAARRGSMARPLDGVRVLVVDDETDARELAAMVLMQAGAEVQEAGSAAEALRCLQRLRPDVVVSDIGMPGQDGHSLIRAIRDLPLPLGAVRAMAVTAFARTEDRHRSLDAGFDIHVVKPVDPTNLVGAVARLVGRDPTVAA